MSPQPDPPAFYKVLRDGRETPYGFGKWPQARRWTEEREPRLCESGWHLCRPQDLIHHVGVGGHIWTAEPHPDAAVVEGSDKVVCSKARLLSETLWDECRARLFAADCAERVLHLYEKRHPEDGRPREAIRVARLNALGLASDEARAAAGAAAGDAAWAAAGAAAGDAAWDAAGAAAWDAAWAAGDDGGWQTDRLIAYLHTEDLAGLLVSQEAPSDAR